MKTMNDIVRCSEGMLQHAEAGQWKDVAVAEEQRRELLNQLFSNPTENAGVPDINNTIQKIIDINKSLEQLAIDARDKTRLELEKIREGRLAVNVYAQHV